MDIQLAIHNRPGSFSDRWVQYCTEHRIKHKIVKCYDSDIMSQLEGVDGLLWHWRHSDPKDQLAARQIIASAENIGIKVFPSTATCWHYNDKVGQKYLLESVGALLVPSYVFFDKQEAMNWADNTEFPKVFKLRCGVSSENVRLVKTKDEAKKLCEKAFQEGFSAVSGYFGDFRRKLRQIKWLGHSFEKLRRMPRAIHDVSVKKRFLPKEKGYIYFQDFLPGNNFDTRVTVIGDRAFGFTRSTRPDDFRASGSGEIVYDRQRIDQRCVQIAFKTVEKLKTQSLAFDFIFDQENKPRITEISYCYQSKAVYNCDGHWDRDMNWHIGHVWPENAILADLLAEIEVGKLGTEFY